MANLKMLLDELTAKATAYAEAYNSRADKSTLKTMKSDITEAVNNYNLVLSKSMYRKWAAEGNAVKEAIRSLYIPGAKRVQFRTNDNDFMTAIISDNSAYYVDLPMMQATLGKEVFADSHWFNKCEKLAFIFAMDLNEKLCDSASFMYHIDESSKEFGFGDIDPLSPEGGVMALQQCFDAILFIPNPDAPEKNLIQTRLKHTRRGEAHSSEWEFIRKLMTRDGGGHKVIIDGTGKFANLVMRAMNLVLTSGSFSLELDNEYSMPAPDSSAHDSAETVSDVAPAPDSSAHDSAETVKAE